MPCWIGYQTARANVRRCASVEPRSHISAFGSERGTAARRWHCVSRVHRRALLNAQQRPVSLSTRRPQGCRRQASQPHARQPSSGRVRATTQHGHCAHARGPDSLPPVPPPGRHESPCVGAARVHAPRQPPQGAAPNVSARPATWCWQQGGLGGGSTASGVGHVGPCRAGTPCAPAVRAQQSPGQPRWHGRGPARRRH